MKAVLVELSPVDPVTETRVTLRVTNVNNSLVTLVSGGPGEFLPVISGGPILSRSIFNGDFSDPGQANDSELAVKLDDATLELWMGYIWGDADVVIRSGNIGDPYSSFVKQWTGTAIGVQRSGGVTVRIGLRPPGALNRPLLYLAFAGTDDGDTGDSGEGRPEVEGVLKPWCAGNARFVAPVLLDSARQIYCYHGYGPTQGASACFEGGVAKGAPTYTWSSFAAMRDAVLAAGEWGHAPSIGMIRLGGQPSFPITIHVGGDKPSGTLLTKLGDILKRILEGPGGMAAPAIPADNLAEINALRGDPIDLYINSSTTVANVLTEVMLAANGYWLENEDGKIILGIVPPGLLGQPKFVPTTNLIATADRLPGDGGWTETGATVAKDTARGSRSFNAITDDSAAASEYTSLPLTGLTVAGTYTFSLRAKKDQVGRATRYCRLRVTINAVTSDIYFDTKTGDFLLAGAAANGKVVDANDSWLLSFETVAGATTGTVDFHPAINAGANLVAAANVAVTGAASVKLFQMYLTGLEIVQEDRTFDLDGKNVPTVIRAGEEAAAVPTYRVRVGGVRTHYVHNPNDIPASIIQAQTTADSKTFTYPTSSTPPVSPAPSEGDLWPDSSTGVIVMRRWNGSAWEAVTETGSNTTLIAIGSMDPTHVAGNSFKRTAAGTDYLYAVRASQVFAGSAYVRQGVSASGVNIVALDDDNSTTALASQRFLFQVSQSTGNWILYVDGASAASGSVGVVTVDTNMELRYLGSKVEAYIAGTKVATKSTALNEAFYAKWWAYQAGNYRQCAAGYAAIEDVATYGDNYVPDGNFRKVGLPDWTVTNILQEAMPAGSPSDYGLHAANTSSGNVTIEASPGGTYFADVTPGQPLSWGAFIKLDEISLTNTVTIALKVQWRNQAGATVGSVITGYSTTATADVDWAFYEATAQAPAGAYKAEFWLEVNNKNGWHVYVTGFRVGKTQMGADITTQLTGPTAINVPYDYLGTTIEDNVDTAYTLGWAGGVVTSGVTMSYKVLTGTINGFNSTSGAQSMTVTGGAGNFSITSMATDTATVQITAVYGGTTRTINVAITKVKAADPGSGGGGGGYTSSQTSGFVTNVSPWTTFANLLTDRIQITMPTGKTTARIIVSLSPKWAPKGQLQTGPWNVEFKVQRNTGTTGSPTWTDIGAVQNSNPDPYIDSTDEGFIFSQAGTMSYSFDDTGRTAGNTYEYRVVARVSTGTTTGNSGGMAYTGSVALSAP